MFKRRNFIKGLVGLAIVPFLPVLDLLRPKKLKLRTIKTKIDIKALLLPRVNHDEIHKDIIESLKEHGFEPANPDLFKKAIFDKVDADINPFHYQNVAR